MLILRSVPFITVYEGEDDAAKAEAAAEAERVAAGAGTGLGGNEDDKPTLSQKQVNAILAKEKAKHQSVIQNQVKQLEQLQKSKGLTEKEKNDLQARIEELNNSLLSKEEISRKEREKMSKEHETRLKEKEEETVAWRSRYTREKIERTILDEATANDGYDPGQFVEILSPKTRLVEALDSEGKPTGAWVPKVSLQDVDKEGNPVTLELSVPEAIKRMKDMSRYGNMFKSGAVGGVGATRTGSGHTGKGKDPSTMTTEEYRKYRREAGLAPKPRVPAK